MKMRNLTMVCEECGREPGGIPPLNSQLTFRVLGTLTVISIKPQPRSYRCCKRKNSFETKPQGKFSLRLKFNFYTNMKKKNTENISCSTGV